LPIQFTEVLGRVESIQRNDRTVSPRFSAWKRMVAAMLRRSELCLSIYLRLRSRSSKVSVSATPSRLSA
jgi:hypothetical protein